MAARYNRSVRLPIVVPAALTLLICLLSGCKKDIQNKEAVRQGIVKYLATRQGLAAMDVDVTSVSFHENEANATVHFQAKGDVAQGPGMTLGYVLERKGNEWVVKGRAGSGDAHGSQSTGMPQEGPSGSMGAMPNTMPPGHPTAPGTEPQALPPGHPPVSPNKKSGQSK